MTIHAPTRSVFVEVRKGRGSRYSTTPGRPRSTLRRLACAGALLWSAVGPTWVWACEGPAAKLVSVEGPVEVRVAGGSAWAAAQPAQTLCTGDTLAVRSLGRAAVVLPNDVVLRLDQGSVLTLQAFAPEKASELGLVQGALHVLTRFTKRFGVITPYLNAMVDGTEFTVRVVDGATSVSVTEGQVRAENRAGEMRLSAGLSVRAAGGQAPVALNLRPADAVQWALFFPQIVRPGASDLQGLPPTAQAAARQAAQGRFGEALAAWPAEAGNALRSARAGWLLGVGQVEAAEELLGSEDAEASSLAVRALVQVVRNQPAEALATAQQAVVLDPSAAAPELALSYAHQAQRDLPLALAAAQRSVQREPDHALAWVRLAELQLSNGSLREGENSAQRALGLNAQTPRAQALLGFAQLLRGRDVAAADALTAAQVTYPADPLPHLGIGLVMLRGGRLAEGRREIEIAVMLDPGNAELRAVLGRAYLNESRDRPAADELKISRELDPLSPTPWFVEGLRKHRGHRPVEAAHDYERALALNDQRAVVRPNSLLDTDRASRTAALASVWRDLGFEGAMLSAARRALIDDPQNEAAHRLLAEAYAATPRNESARVSELLQSQLRQSPRTEPVAPQALLPGLPVVNGPRAVTLQETAPLFDESRGGARLGLMAGNRGLFGTAATAWRSVGNGQLSLGHFHYETDGFRQGADLRLDTNNILWQTALTPELNVQAELRSTQREGGDITQRLVPDSAAPKRRRAFESDAARVGLRYATGYDSEWLGSLVRINREATVVDVTGTIRFPLTATVFNDRSALLAELMYGSQTSHFRWAAGVSNYREDQEQRLTTSIDGLPISRPPTVTLLPSSTKHDVGFAYASLNSNRLTYHLGLSQDDFSKGGISIHQTSPKLGLGWQVSDATTARLAKIRSVRGSVAKEQTIEPTQFAGFNQLFDDQEGARSDKKAFALDHTLGTSHVGLEVAQRRLDVPTVVITPIPGCLRTVCNLGWTESSSMLYFDQRVNDRWVWTANLDYSKQVSRTPGGVTNLPVKTRTVQVPLRLAHFHTQGWFSHLQLRRVQQSVDFGTGSVRHASTQFWLADTGVRIHFSKRASVSLDVNNLFNRKFGYQDTYLSGDPRVPLFQPGRTIMVRAEIRL